MYIVTRTFRDANGVFGVGSVVDPTSVKSFRTRLQQRHIVDVNEGSVTEWTEFFKNRHGIDLSDKLAEYLNAQPETEKPVGTAEETAVENAESAELKEAEPVETTTFSEEDESW